MTSYTTMSAGDRALIDDADILVRQVQDFATVSTLPSASSGAAMFNVPVVSGGFLWPYCGKPHPRNAPSPYFSEGPYHNQVGDGFLNGMIAQGVAPEAALARYLECDIAAERSLDRLYRITIDKQRRLDRETGYDVAGVIERHLTDEPLFNDAYHPGTRIMRHLAIRLFEHMGIDNAQLVRANTLLRWTNMPRECVPVHPAVGRYYGLPWATGDRRYMLLREGRFTFDQWALRYMRYEWNEALEQGIGLADRCDDALALPILIRAAEVSPLSAAARCSMSQIHLRNGDLAAAIDTAQAACALDPEHPPLRSYLGHVRAQAGEWPGAAIAFAEAAALDPADATVCYAQGFAWRHLGQLDEAVAACRAAIDLDPREEKYRAQLVELLDAAGLSGRAVEVGRDLAAVAEEEETAAGLAARTQRLLRSGDADASVVCAERALALEPDNAAYRAALGAALAAAGRSKEAEAALRAALDLAPQDAGIHSILAHTLTALGRNQDALIAAQAAAALQPGNAYLHLHIGHLLVAEGTLGPAQAAFERAVDLAPDKADYHSALAHMYGLRQDFAAAAASISRALRIDPTNLHFENHRLLLVEKQACTVLPGDDRAG